MTIAYSRRRINDPESPFKGSRRENIIPAITLLEIDRLANERRYYAGRLPTDEAEDAAGSIYRRSVA